MIKSVSVVSIPVRDQSKALEFYTKKLGFQILTDQPFGVQRWIELCVPGSETKLALFTPPGQESRIGTFSNIGFFTDDMDKTYQTLAARGVEFEKLPKKEPWGTSAVFKDMDGNTFALSSK